MQIEEVPVEQRLIRAHLQVRDPLAKDRWLNFVELDVVFCSLAPGEHDLVKKHPCEVKYTPESRQALIDFRHFAGDGNLRVNIVYAKDVAGSC